MLYFLVMLEYCLFVSSIIVCLFSCDNNALEDWELHLLLFLFTASSIYTGMTMAE